MAQDRLTRQQRRQIRELIATHDPLIQAAFIQAVNNAKGALDFDALTAAVRANDLQRAFDMLRLNQAVLWPLDEAIRAAIYAGGATVTLPRGVQGAFGFNGRHPRAEQIVQETGARLVTELGNPGIEPIRDIILQGQREGLGAQRTAQNLAGKLNRRTGLREGGIMGLDGPRAERAAKVRTILSDPDRIGEYFKGDKPRFTRTDRRFDAQVRKAIDQGKALSPDQVDRIAKQHDARLIKDRSTVIAQNEAFRAQAQGRREAYAQLMESGQLETLDKSWRHNTSKNPRHDHAALDGKTIPFDDDFVMADGTRMKMPHDPNAGPEHSVGCRCSMIYKPKYRRPT